MPESPFNLFQRLQQSLLNQHCREFLPEVDEDSLYSVQLAQWGLENLEDLPHPARKFRHALEQQLDLLTGWFEDPVQAQKLLLADPESDPFQAGLENVPESDQQSPEGVANDLLVNLYQNMSAVLPALREAPPFA